ncbi:GIY-YIG nuclease family protein [Melioribacteraceae bacterium 4301-Me]|uniref:GIY-YIG nuclease family protein n=1 Tax=Pyranulibacter aquaticus TaxID=3163344 RepID=UPI00359A0E14
MSYSVYIIKSLKTGLHYIGHTSDIEDRLRRHNEDRSKYTKGKGPWEVVISYRCRTKSEAYQLEVKLKSYKNHQKAINYLKNLSQG